MAISEKFPHAPNQFGDMFSDYGWTCPTCGAFLLHGTQHFCPGRYPHDPVAYTWKPFRYSDAIETLKRTVKEAEEHIRRINPYDGLYIEDD